MNHVEPMDWEESPPPPTPVSKVSVSIPKMKHNEKNATSLSKDLTFPLPMEIDPVEDPGDCMICLANLSEPAEDDVTFPSNRLLEVIKTPCKHEFHKVCLIKWIKQSFRSRGRPTCPVCRAKFKMEAAAICRSCGRPIFQHRHH